MISVCMAYHNRASQLDQTLKSLLLSSVKDYEVVIVDDNSEEGHRLEDVIGSWSGRIDIRLKRIDSDDKDWCNPCIPYNMAFDMARGDKIVVQNPECAHVGDILAKVDEELVDGVYQNFACLSYTEGFTKAMVGQEFGPGDVNKLNAIASGVHKCATSAGDLAWYNHSRFNPRLLHFCSAITANDLKRIGGFDERFRDGYNFDDNEFVWRVGSSDMKIVVYDSPFVIHQWHYGDSFVLTDPDHQTKMNKNQSLFQDIVEGRLQRFLP